MTRFQTSLGAGAAALLLLTGCTAPSAPDASRDVSAPRISVAASFYPLEFVAQAVAGDLGEVTSLAPPGVEPHDLELSPSAVRSLADTDVVLFISQFQPAVDAALETTGAHGFDVTQVIELHASDHNHESEEDHEGEESATDPHFWLDPHLLAEYATAVADEFGRIDPANGDTYTANGAALVDQLTSLSDEFEAGLAACERDVIVVSHEAFAYMIEEHGISQEGVAGLEPDTEPSPARLREIAEIIEHTGSTTVFTEKAASAKVVEALAQDAGVDTAVLDPLETIADGDDYIGVMQRNLEALRLALDCE